MLIVILSYTKMSYYMIFFQKIKIWDVIQKVTQETFITIGIIKK